MITFVEGLLVEKQPTSAVLNVGGVGYELFIPISSYDRLPPLNSTCRLLTFDCVREDAHLLYGFVTEAERRLFLLLLSINGIGPKLALRALSGLSPRELKAAIVEGDVARLSSISGIGKKTAERIVVDLRDKIDSGEALEAISGRGEPTPEDMKLRDAILALIALGYKQDEARKMVTTVAKAAAIAGMSTEDVVKKALGR